MIERKNVDILASSVTEEKKLVTLPNKKYIPKHEINIKLLKEESKQLEKNARMYMLTVDVDLYKCFVRWLQIRNIVNMEKICNSFCENRLHYPDFERYPKKNSVNTSLHSLDRIFIQDKPGYGFIRGFSYRIKSGYDAAKTLKSFLYSYTTLDCTASISLAFSLTLYDVIKLIHMDKADDVFNTLFGSHRPVQERFSIDNFGNYLQPGKQYLISPLQYFGQFIEGLSLSELLKQPDNFLGMKLYIQGHKNYLAKHPNGASQGWNVIFCGLNGSEPLFLAARGPSENFYLTYNELITLLTNDYNKLPEFHSKSYSNELATKKEIVGLISYGAYLNIDRLLMLKNIEKINTALSQFITKEQVGKNTHLDPKDVLNSESFFIKPKQLIKDKIKPFESLDTEIKIPTFNQLKRNKKLIDQNNLFKRKRDDMGEKNKIYSKRKLGFS